MKPVMLAQPDESRAASIQITRPRGPTSRPPLCLPLRPERERLGRRQRHVLQVGLARPTDVGQRAGVGMIEPRSGAGLALKASADLRRRGQVRGWTSMAISRPRRASRARYTSPIAPRSAGRQPCTVRGCCLRPAWSLSRRRADDSAPNLRLHCPKSRSRVIGGLLSRSCCAILIGGGVQTELAGHASPREQISAAGRRSRMPAGNRGR